MSYDTPNNAVIEPSEMRELSLSELEIVAGGDSEPIEPFEWLVPWPGRPMPKPV
jgi:hypothetical protein